MFKKLFKSSKKEPERPNRKKEDAFTGGRQQKKEMDKKESGVDVKESQQPKDVPKAPPVKSAASGGVAFYADVLVRPQVTEKATGLSGGNAYVFVVQKSSTKPQIKKAVQELYGVTPQRVNVVNFPAKRVRSNRGIWGERGGGKKAVVYLKEGESIEVT